MLVLNVAHAGRFWMLYVRLSPSASEPFAWKEYAAPTLTLVAGVPLIVGRSFVFEAALTRMLNAGSDALSRPSLTLITMLLNVPTCALVGVPLRRPVEVLNVAQLGRF